jgi:hypothetical protein
MMMVKLNVRFPAFDLLLSLAPDDNDVGRHGRALIAVY